MKHKKLPDGLTIDHIMQAVEDDDNTGFCLNCGEIADYVEPDAREYTCEACGENAVYGAEELLLEFGL